MASRHLGRASLRLFCGGIAAETNMFSPLVTGLADYEIAGSADGSGDRSSKVSGSALGASLERYDVAVTAAGGSCVKGFFATATPAGPTTRAAYESMRAALLQDLRDALPVDGVLLTLHGAMVADGYVDCETDIVLNVRELVGTKVTIGVLLDPHCDLPDDLVDAADVIVAFKEYPHVDIEARADDLARLVIAAARGETNPVIATFDCRTIGLYPTTGAHMREFVERMKRVESQSPILSVSLGHGFPWGDSPANGARLLVVSDDDREAASELAAELGREFFSLRYEVGLQPVSMRAALDEAFAVSQSKRPVVVADVADNCGGGAPGDSTFLLRELLDGAAENAALALLWDPIVVHQAFAAGEGAHLTVRVGGKMGPTSGDPLDVNVRVRGLVDDLIQHTPLLEGAREITCGACACLSCGGIDIIVGSLRRQVYGLEVFSSFGLDPRDRAVLVVKSTNHFHAAYAPIAAKIIHAETPGALSMAFSAIPYRRIDRQKFPWIDDPWADDMASAPLSKS